MSYLGGQGLLVRQGDELCQATTGIKPRGDSDALLPRMRHEDGAAGLLSHRVGASPEGPLHLSLPVSALCPSVSGLFRGAQSGRTARL